MRITFRASGTHRSKNKSTSYEVLLFLAGEEGFALEFCKTVSFYASLCLAKSFGHRLKRAPGTFFNALVQILLCSFTTIKTKATKRIFFAVCNKVLNSNAKSRRKACISSILQELYITNGLPLYIIKPQTDTRCRVMRYSPKGADDMHHASRGDDIPSLRLG